ncbi:hypothetical protein [Variovorax soli]|uniref:MBG domain-containing protein n=1 Tax=Variovorax soli TaxID=376815 RepID=A0ABU1NMP3_9BURK|nr:hypothetical protein [Variovorax soli]MDR6539717.1 hypothetical protein [Variovorax soli]
MQGVIHGTNGSSSDGKYTASVTDYYGTGQVYRGNVSATYTPRTKINGTVSTTGTTATFDGVGIPVEVFNYDLPASLADVVGNWNGSTVQGDTGSIAITSTGAFSGSLSGCNVSGQLTPRISGKNVFDLALTFGGSPCLLPGQSASGIALKANATDGRSQLIVVGETASGAGTAFFSAR